MTELNTSTLSQVCGAAGRTPPAAAGAAANPNPFNTWANAWTNILTAPMTYSPPFSTTPLFPTPFY